MSRGGVVQGRGSSKILQRSNIISNNNGTPNLKANKSKIKQVVSGQNSIDDNMYPYSNSIENAVLSNKDIDIYNSKQD